ncbi:MAG: kelch repeat-containing protein [bacterium]|nr:kelch repeat-containing protein [bacterium]
MISRRDENIYIILLAVLVFIGIIGSEVSVFADSWIRKADMPTGRNSPGIAVFESKVYVIGGSNPVGLQYFRINEEYDPSTDSWVMKASMPTPRRGLAAATANGKIYAIGGTGPWGVCWNNENEEYNPVTNTWIKKADMPTIRWGLGAATFRSKTAIEKIYVIGGWAGNNPPVAANEEYDPSTNTWTTKTPLPTPRQYLAVVATETRIYAVGGWDYSSMSRANEEYDPETNTWSIKADMPTARGNLGAATVMGKVYAIGGFSHSTPFETANEEYNPETDTWSTKAPMPTGRQHVAVVAVGKNIYAIGGWSLQGHAQSVNEEYSPDIGVEETQNVKFEMQNAKLTILPNPFNRKTVISVQGLVLSEAKNLSLQIYDLTGRLVKSFPLIPTGVAAVTWAGIDDFGKLLPAGVYFCKLERSKSSVTYQIILMR